MIGRTESDNISNPTVNKLLFSKPKPCVVKPLIINIQIGNKFYNAQIDTGSGMSYISSEVFDKISLDNSVVKKVENCNQVVMLADSTKMTVKNIVYIHFFLKSFSWTFPFGVAPLPVPILIGRDFIYKSKMIINTYENNISFEFKPSVVINTNSELTEENINSLSSQADCQNRSHSLEHQVLSDLVSELSDVSLSEEILEKSVNSDLDSHSRLKIKKLLYNYSNVITKRIGKTHLLKYHVTLTDYTPIKAKVYHLAPPKMEALQSCLDELLQQNIISYSTSPYSSPSFIVKKKPSGWRLITDFRAINSKVVCESTPMPTIESATQYLGDAVYYSTFDLGSAFYQIALDEESKQYTSFVTPQAQYHYNFLPMGFKPSAQVLTRLLNMVFSDLQYKGIFIFHDDIIVYSKTVGQQIKLLGLVLKKLADAGLTLNPSKMKICHTRIEFLGHIFEHGRLSINPDRIKPIYETPVPRNVKQLARFLGVVGFYMRFIPCFGELTAPLNKLRRKNEPFVWGPDQQKAFDSVKKFLVSSPILKLPDFNKEFILMTDASKKSLGAVLMQCNETGTRLPVAYASRILQQHERNKTIYELEAMAIYFGIMKFRQYLEHNHFFLETDNSALTYLIKGARLNNKLARWSSQIGSFNFTVKHIRGYENKIADFLSRMYEDIDEDETSRDQNEIQNSQNLILCSLPEVFQNIQTLQESDPEITKLKQESQNKKDSKYFMKKNVLLYKSKPNSTHVVVPKSLVPLLFTYYHSSATAAHPGVTRTIKNIKAKFYWSTMITDITKLVKQCHECQVAKQAQNTKVGFMSSQISTYCLERVFIDYIGPLPSSSLGNKYVLVITDGFSKFSIFIPTRNLTAETTVRMLDLRFFSYFGFPKNLVTDRGVSFLNAKFETMCLNYGIRHVVLSPYYPKPNQAERINKQLKIALRIYHHANQVKWDTKLHLFQQAFNSGYHSAINTNPNSLMFQYQVQGSLENYWNLSELLENTDNITSEQRWQAAITSLKNSHLSRAKKYNQNRKPNMYKVGDTVTMLNHSVSKKVDKISKKLNNIYEGPYIIVHFSTPVTAVLQSVNNKSKFNSAHISHLKPYVTAVAGTSGVSMTG